MAGVLVNKSLCEQPTEGKKKRVSFGGSTVRSCTPKGWDSQRSIQERQSWREKLGRVGYTGLDSEQ